MRRNSRRGRRKIQRRNTEFKKRTEIQEKISTNPWNVKSVE
jgi:hypothetical protein